MDLTILPLAVTMMAGPAIMAAVVFVTHKEALRVSMAFLAAVAIATTVGVAITRGIVSLLSDNVSLGDSSDKSSLGTIIQLALVALRRSRRSGSTPSWRRTRSEPS
jgi:small neutral amino acid transporter SnatA (MarC family)